MSREGLRSRRVSLGYHSAPTELLLNRRKKERKTNLAALVPLARRPHICSMALNWGRFSYVFKLSRPVSLPVQIASSIIRAPLASHAGGFVAIRQYHIARCFTVYTTTSKTNAHRRTAGAEMSKVGALT